MLPHPHRVTRGAEYKHVVRSGARLPNRCSIAYVVMTEATSPARFGFIVSKAVGKAHERNVVRRRMKAICAALVRQQADECEAPVTGMDVVFRLLPRSQSASFTELEAEVRSVFRRLAKKQRV